MSGAPTPNLIVQSWAEGVSSTYLTAPMPIPTQLPGQPGRASYATGFPPQTFEQQVAGGTGPDGRDLNGVLNDVTGNVAAFCGGQFWPFNATWATANSGYKKSAIVLMANGAGLWINTTDGNTNNPDTTPPYTSGWVALCCSGASSITPTSQFQVLTAPQAASEYLIFVGTLTQNCSINLPAWGRVWKVSNQTGGNFSVTLYSAGSGTVTVPQGGGIGLAAVDAAGNITGIISAPAFNN